MKTFKVMDVTGDTEYKFASAQSAQAEELFNSLVKNHIAYKRGPDGGDQQVKSFKDTDDATLFAPQLQGG